MAVRILEIRVSNIIRAPGNIESLLADISRLAFGWKHVPGKVSLTCNYGDFSILKIWLRTPNLLLQGSADADQDSV